MAAFRFLLLAAAACAAVVADDAVVSDTDAATATPSATPEPEPSEATAAGDAGTIQTAFVGRYIVKFRESARAAAGNPPAFAMVHSLLTSAAASGVTRYLQFTSTAFGSFVVINAPASVAAALASMPAVVETVFQDFQLYPAVVRVAPLSAAAATAAAGARLSRSAGGLRGTARRLASRSGWNPALDRLDQRAGPTDGTFNYFSSGGVAMDGSGVDVYVLDSGIRYDHDEFEGRIETTLARNFVNDGQVFGSTNASDSCLGHGTFVASQIAGSCLGIAPGVRLIPIRVFSCAGVGSFSSLLAAVDYIVSTAPTTGRKSIVNFSGAAGASTFYDALAERLLAAGAPLVDSAGNDGVSACTRSPARAPASFSVGASDASDTWASFSNYGSCVNLTAVGVDNIGAWHTDSQAYAQGSGTSFATPLVTGLAATIWGALPANASWSTVTTILTASATRGTLTSLPAGTPNLLAYSGPVGGLAELVGGWSPSSTATSTPSSTQSITPSASVLATPSPAVTPTATSTRTARAGAVASAVTATRTRSRATRLPTPTRSGSRARPAPSKPPTASTSRSASQKDKPRRQ